MMKLVRSKVTLLASPVPTLLHRAPKTLAMRRREDDMDREEEAQECILDPWSEHATNVAAGGSQKKGSPKKREKGFPLAKLDIA